MFIIIKIDDNDDGDDGNNDDGDDDGAADVKNSKEYWYGKKIVYGSSYINKMFKKEMGKWIAYKSMECSKYRTLL